MFFFYLKGFNGRQNELIDMDMNIIKSSSFNLWKKTFKLHVSPSNALPSSVCISVIGIPENRALTKVPLGRQRAIKCLILFQIN